MQHVSLLARDVLEFVQWKCTKEKPVKIERLAELMRATRREIELAGEELRRAGVALCSSCGTQSGWYVARNYQEALPWVKQIDNRMRRMAINRANAIKALKWLAERDGCAEQLRIDFDGEKISR